MTDQESQIAELKDTFQHAKAWAVYVVSKNDFSREGEREFLTALNTVKIAKDNLWYAEQAASSAEAVTV